MKVRGFVVICKLLKGQKILVCFDRRRGVLAAEFLLTGRTVLFLFSWRWTTGAVCDFFVISCQTLMISTMFCVCCHHVVAIPSFSLDSYHHVGIIFWARFLGYLAAEEACFRMRVILGVIFIRSFACTQCVPGGLRSGSGIACNSGLMRKSSRRANAPSMRFSVLLNSFDNLFVTIPSISSETWVM